ncbi:hypothetical protein HGRIS_003172 [Hohenbuehelia grisea]|uniref:RBR-type E3 ubiquitin transferase n=1 Tax=Hohenbuehelia grisea TaxID=104357 RepID=A0ABR3JNN8_9AGAR
MSSEDYELSDEDYYDEDDMMDTQDDDGASAISEDMDTMDDFKISTKPVRKSYEIDSESLSQVAVEDLMNKDVEHICGIFGVPVDTASLLLRHMLWNKELLIEKYMDQPTAMLCAAGVAAPEPSSPEPSRSHSAASGSTTRRSTRSASKLLGLGKSKASSPISPVSSTASKLIPPKSGGPESFVCPICFDDTPDVPTLALVCDHQYCVNCWNAYISSKLRDEAEHAIRCMAEGCALVAPDEFVRSALKTAAVVDPTLNEDTDKLLSRFQELLVRQFVGANRKLKYCPYPGCTNTVSCPSAATKSSLNMVVPTVSCGARGIGTSMTSSQVLERESLGLQAKEHTFCFGCPIESDHRPVVCNVAKMWLKKCHDDSETANWIKTNTKECSQCQSTIEKNGGCNHMTCKKCKYEFCWVCMGPWSEHGTAWYSCNRFDEKAGVDARDAQSKSRASLERYLHYYNRWANHEQSAKLSLDLYSKTEKKMEEMQITSSLTWIEVQFMKKAVEEVDKCRRTLKWTYAMAYYLAKGNEKELFEDNQSNLEQAVEELSELLESPIEADIIPTLRQKVTDKTVYVQKRNDIVLEDTANGFLDGRWKWNTPVDGFDDPENMEN